MTLAVHGSLSPIHQPTSLATSLAKGIVVYNTVAGRVSDGIPFASKSCLIGRVKISRPNSRHDTPML